MGIKHLDYLSFKKAFLLYFDRAGSVTEALQREIELIRANHNTKRTNFKPTEGFKSIITDYKLLGLIEGEGCFFVQKAGLTPRFELELTSAQKPLLTLIIDYLLSKFASLYTTDAGNPLLISKGGIKLRDTKAKYENGKGGVRLEITGVEFLHRYFNTYLKDLKFYSNKEIDFKEFCFICETLYKKAHIDKPEVKQLLLDRIGGMNKARLSTYKKNKVDS